MSFVLSTSLVVIFTWFKNLTLKHILTELCFIFRPQKNLSWCVCLDAPEFSLSSQRPFMSVFLSPAEDQTCFCCSTSLMSALRLIISCFNLRPYERRALFGRENTARKNYTFETEWVRRLAPDLAKVDKGPEVLMLEDAKNLLTCLKLNRKCQPISVDDVTKWNIYVGMFTCGETEALRWCYFQSLCSWKDQCLPTLTSSFLLSDWPPLPAQGQLSEVFFECSFYNVFTVWSTLAVCTFRKAKSLQQSWQDSAGECSHVELFSLSLVSIVFKLSIKNN